VVWCIGACVFAGLVGAALARLLCGWYQRKKTRIRMQEAAGITSQAQTYGLCVEGLANRVICFCISLSEQLSSGKTQAWCVRVPFLQKRWSVWYGAHKNTAGLGNLISLEGFCEAKLRGACLASLVCALCGMVFSNELAIIGLLGGAALGCAAPRWACAQEERMRADQLERELPQMLEVVALGLRSGLSFNRSLRLYHEHFSSPFAQGWASAQRQWELGLQTREEALRAFAASYSSVTCARVVETIIRSLYFGSSFAAQLEDAALRAREQHSAKREEQIAKAPVKMMIPTGTLILPAMLILVLGPVLLELIGGF